MTVDQALVLAGGAVGLVLGVAAITKMVLSGIEKMLDRKLDDMRDQLAEVAAAVEYVSQEVSLNHGTSLKDGVLAITRHLGLEFDPPRVRVKLKAADEASVVEVDRGP